MNDRTARLLTGAIGGAAGAFTTACVPALRRGDDRLTIVGDWPGTLTSLMAHMVYGIATAIVAHVTHVCLSQEAIRSRRRTT